MYVTTSLTDTQDTDAQPPAQAQAQAQGRVSSRSQAVKIFQETEAPGTGTGTGDRRGDGSRPRFVLSHPKNYIGAPLAVAADQDTGALIAQHLVQLSGAVRRGAEALDLVTDGKAVTGRGNVIVTHAEQVHGSVDAGLTVLAGLKGDGTRFIDAVPAWRGVTQATVVTHDPFATVLDVVSRVAGTDGMMMAELCENERVTDSEQAVLDDGEIVSHVKSLLWHAGLLTDPGVTSDIYDPGSDWWEIDEDTIVPVVADVITGGDA